MKTFVRDRPSTSREETAFAGPISPELVLVDPELAASARALLSNEPPRYGSSPASAVDLAESGAAEAEELRSSDASPVAVAAAAGEAAEGSRVRTLGAEADAWEFGRSPRRRRLLGRFVVAILVLLLAAAIVLAAGYSSAERSSSTDGESGPPASAPTAEDVRPPKRRVAAPAPRARRVREAAPRRKRRSVNRVARRSRPKTRPAPASGQRRVPPSARRPSNVLGVVVSTRSGVVTLRWQPPRDATGVVILRRPGRGSGESTMYVGNRTVYVDRTVRDGTPYRYLIITKGPRGTLSTGVPAIVTPGRSK